MLIVSVVHYKKKLASVHYQFKVIPIKHIIWYSLYSLFVWQEKKWPIDIISDHRITDGALINKNK